MGSFPFRTDIDIPCLKNVQPEDIEDVSERYRPYLGTEFESDTVKRVRIHGDNAADSDNRLQEPLFLISLTEHKSQVDYDVSMQLLKYMLCIWLDYGSGSMITAMRNCSHAATKYL